ncbi:MULTISPECIES: Rv3235 family protein [Nocardiaceae]|jgi:hypothetical protein|uniref:Rv3235 family protein n=1 Tax=Nocardiaceae TaxID=85025 RepID=UPI001F4CC27D|nr:MULTISPECIES: Rv3235 family protein [Rhodococcus]
MNAMSDARRFAYIARAATFEPPTDSARASDGRVTDSRSAPAACSRPIRRRRPFPRSVGHHDHPGVADLANSNGSRIGPLTAVSENSVSDDARRGAEQAVRLLLEVLDRRRPPEKMGLLFAPNVVESVRTIARTEPPGRRLGAASLRRIHVTHAARNATEVFGTYTRGTRVFAVAARLEYRRSLKYTGWTVTSLRVV